MATQENALAAFGGASQASIRYDSFSERATGEHYPGIATLFKAIAGARAIQARRLLAISGEVRSTAENLEAGISAETREAGVTYPAYLKEAGEEKKFEARAVFSSCIRAEEVLAALFSTARTAVSEGHDMASISVYLCPVCGHISLGQPPFRCPICGVFAKKYVRIVQGMENPERK